MPYGEALVDKHTSPWKVPYTFSAKEQDAETKLTYFEARYYDSKYITFLSVDPQWVRYPGISPYMYCADNPAKYVDPDGEFLYIIVGGIVGAVKEVVSQTITNGIKNLNSGNGFFKGWAKSMDWADVGISAGEGALAAGTLGVSLAAHGAFSAARSAVDWKGGSNIQFVGATYFGLNEKFQKEWKDAALDFAVEMTSLGIGKFTGLNNIDFAGDFGTEMFGAFFKGSLNGVWNWGINEGRDYLENELLIPTISTTLPEIKIGFEHERGKVTIPQGEVKRLQDHMKKGYELWEEINNRNW